MQWLYKKDSVLLSDKEQKIFNNPKKLGGPSNYKEVFKSEWKKYYPIQEVTHKKIHSFCLPKGKTLSCHH